MLIIGCGYLGLPAARLWQKADCQVAAVTRSAAKADRLRAMGLTPVIADITSPHSLHQLPDADAVLFAVGFDRSRYDDIEAVYVDGLQNVLSHLSTTTDHLIYISSTGVHADTGGQWVDENSKPAPRRPGAIACWKAEALIRNSHLGDRSTILRLAGIYGTGRIPMQSAIRDRDWSRLSPHGHLNLIHVADAAAICVLTVQQQLKGELFLVSDGQPCQRRTFYEFVAQQLGTGPIDWEAASSSSNPPRADKKISNRKLVETTGYRFQYPSYQSGLLASLRDGDRLSVADATDDA